jgi:peptide/nickel transport system permease protein
MTERPLNPATTKPQRPGWLARARDSDLWFSFKRSKITVAAAIVTGLLVLGAVLAPLLSLQNPWNPAELMLSNASKPPVFAGGEWAFPLGTDDQGRDVYSALLYGTRLSLVVGLLSVALAILIGVTLGLLAGYVGGAVDAFIMRVADVQLTFPAILIALTIDGIVRGIVSAKRHEEIAFVVIVVSIGLSFWVQFARTVRGAVLVEKNKEYVQAARVTGLPAWRIAVRHVLPNALGPVLVIATINLALAVITEATLSFLGVGMPPTTPSLGTLIRIGNEFLLSGDWWITVFPGIVLALLVLAVNLLGDWLRDALNPKLR